MNESARVLSLDNRFYQDPTSEEKVTASQSRSVEEDFRWIVSKNPTFSIEMCENHCISKQNLKISEISVYFFLHDYWELSKSLENPSNLDSFW